MPFPNAVLAQQADFLEPEYTAILLTFQAQVFLTKRLTRIQALWTGVPAGTPPPQVLVDLVEEELLAIQDMQWLPQFPPLTSPGLGDVLNSRVLSRYWDIRVSAYQPVLDLALGSPGNIDRFEWQIKRGVHAMAESMRAFQALPAADRIQEM
jgi:hypothetical protein